MLKCENCSEECLTCYGSLSTNCLSCPPSSYLKSSLCSPTLPHPFLPQSRILDFPNIFSKNPVFHCFIRRSFIHLQRQFVNDFRWGLMELMGVCMGLTSHGSVIAMVLKKCISTTSVVSFNNISEVYLKDTYNYSFNISLTTSKPSL